MDHKAAGVPKALGVMCTVAMLSVGGAALSAASAGADTACVPATVSIGPYIDPATGQINLNAYLAAVQAANAVCSASGTGGSNSNGVATPVLNGGNGTGGSGGSSLPFTGTDAAELAAAGIALVTVGGAAVVMSRRRAHEA